MGNVVTFKNVVCRTNSALAQIGTCVTGLECSEKKGTARGNCASGFGVCCVLINNFCNSTINQNNTYLWTTGFPSDFELTQKQIQGNENPAETCQFNIKKCQNDICTLRMDFEHFNLLAGT